MEIVCLESEAFFKLLEEVLKRLRHHRPETTEKWISGPEAMRMLRIKSKATLQKMRDEGVIRFSHPEKRIILYDVDSINAYLEDFVYETFDMPKDKKRKLL
ncbi:MAG: helix-turn-helix domain-containing protein [Mucilaginibacter sp.]|nr:helix-turn-helix domain-containing protein [Mucilaginibacter sp.]